MSSAYVLDSNVFMEAARRYYAFDLVPPFWKALISLATNGLVISLDRVKAEIDRGKDELKEWANKDFHQWFVSTDQTDITSAYGRIMVWAANEKQFTNAAKAEVAKTDKADPWVVAYAIANSCIVVTHEQFDPNIKSDIPIPNVCKAFNVQYVDTFQMLRNLGVKLGS